MYHDDFSWCFFMILHGVFHDVSWISWYFMMFHDAWWCLMMFHGTSWNFHDVSWNSNDVSWSFMIFRDISCCFMMFHDVSWCFIMLHDVFRDVFPWYSWCFRRFMMFHGISLVFNDVSWFFMVFHDASWYVSWCFMIFHGAFHNVFPWCFMIFMMFSCCYMMLSWYFMMFFMTFHDVSWYFIVFHDISTRETFKYFSQRASRRLVYVCLGAYENDCCRRATQRNVPSVAMRPRFGPMRCFVWWVDFQMLEICYNHGSQS